MTRYLAIFLILLATQRAHADPCSCELVDPGKERRRTSKIVAASGLGLLGASFAITMYAKVKYDNAIDRLEALENAPYDPANYPARASARDEANDARDVARFGGTALFLGGTVAVGVATYLYLTSPSKEIVLKTTVAPSAGQRFTGVTITRAF